MKRFFILFVLIFIMLITGTKEKFFILILAVAIHELAHIFTAIFFGYKPNKIFITPIGQLITIKNLERLSFCKRILVIASGPIANLLCYYITNIMFHNKFNDFKKYSLAIACLNLLPVIPFDGGRLLQNILGNLIGILRSNKAITKCTQNIGILLILVGLIQVALFPFNFSLFCIGVYVLKNLLKEKLIMASEFYKFVLYKRNKIKTNTIKAKIIVASENTTNKKILFKIKYDYYLIIHILKDNKIEYILTESEFIEHIINNGIKATLGEQKIKEL